MKWHFWRDHIGIKNADGNYICPYRCKKTWSTASVDGFAAHMRRIHPVTKLDGAIVLERAQAVDVQCDFCEQKESVLGAGQRYGGE